MGLKVYTGGTFDLFHAGHVEFLRKCSRYGRVVVSLNTDEFIKEYKGSAPVMSYYERKTVLEACRYVDEVIPNYGGVDSRPSIMAIMPDIIIIGSDWAVRDYHKQMGFTQEWLDKRNIALCYVPYTAGISSTEVKKRLSVVK
jgi:glycerol-3-phosphate cytidylyltransferase